MSKLYVDEIFPKDGAKIQAEDLQLPAGSILQVKHVEYTGLYSSTSATPSDVAGFSVSITPKSSTSKILVTVDVAIGFAQDAYPYVLLTRNGTSIGTGDTATGSRINTFLGGYATNISTMPYRIHHVSKTYLDSPTTDQELTYQIQFASPYVGFAGYINRTHADADAVYIQRPASGITVMEVAQ